MIIRPGYRKIFPSLQDRGKGKCFIPPKRGESFDTDKDFSAPERHILQKLFIWKDFAANVEEFRSKKEEALRKGWNDSGPIQESRNLQNITVDLEEEVARRVLAAEQEQG